MESLEPRRLFTALLGTVHKFATGGTSPQAIASADFNGDKLPDMAVTNAADGTVTIFLNKGGGSFTALKPFKAGSNTGGLVIGDFNGDGKPDLAVVGDQLAICLGQGSGKFAAPTYYAAGNTPQFAVAADFNGDGKLDLAVTNILGDTVSIFMSKGGGQFNSATTIKGIPGAGGIVAADFNGDKKEDLAVTSLGHITFDALGNVNYGHADGVRLLLGNGKGSFTLGKAFTVGTRPISIAAGDLNGDGKLDLVTANGGLDSSDGQNTVSVLISNGSGSFASAKSYTTGATPEGVVLADMNRDGKLDIITANYNGNNVSVLTNKGNGTFNSAVNFAAGQGNGQLVAVDINKDKKIDILAAGFLDDTLDVLLGQ